MQANVPLDVFGQISFLVSNLKVHSYPNFMSVYYSMHFEDLSYNTVFFDTLTQQPLWNKNA